MIVDMKKALLYVIAMASCALLGAGAVYIFLGVKIGFVMLGLASMLLLSSGIYIYIDYQAHKRPLVAEDPKVPYTLTHHLHQVTIPLFRHRISLVLKRRNSMIKHF